MALKYFDELLKRVTSEELKAIDEFVSEQDPYTIYTNLSRQSELRRGSLSEQPSSLEDTYSRRGLKWVMGLARLEYAAILGTFTTTPDPFVTVRPSPFELSAYKSLLLDAVRTHYWALMRDPQVKRATRTSPEDSGALSYSRRVGVTRKMLSALAKSSMSEMNPQQYRELAIWNRDLDGLQRGLLGIIRAYVNAMAVQQRTLTKTKEEREFAAACGMQLRAERYELKKGTAKVKTYGNTPAP